MMRDGIIAIAFLTSAPYAARHVSQRKG